MIDRELVFFLLSLLVGVFWFRILFLFVPHPYKDGSFMRSLTGLKWHHWHTGMVFLTAGMAIIIYQGKTLAALIFLGLGLGLVVDEFFMTLRLETQREEELKVYSGSFGETLILTLAISVVFLLISFSF